MYIDDNIPADNYCGIILKAEQQEDTDIYGNVKWRRIYLWVDIAKGLYKEYFTHNYLKGGKQEWQGVMSIYLPNTDDCSAPDDTKKLCKIYRYCNSIINWISYQVDLLVC